MKEREIIGLMAAAIWSQRGSAPSYQMFDAVREAEMLWEATYKTEIRVCAHCGDRFRRPNAQRRARFCSAQCRLKAWRKEREGFKMPRALQAGGYRETGTPQ